MFRLFQTKEAEHWTKEGKTNAEARNQDLGIRKNFVRQVNMHQVEATGFG